jgi:hypothetical protein
MTPLLAFGGAAAVAAAIAAWWYGRREEKVRGRGLAAVLKGAALFLLLSSPWMPSLAGRGEIGPRTAILVDISRSMGYPAGSNGDVSRLQVAREAVAEMLASRRSAEVWSFASAAARIDRAELLDLEATGSASRVVDALEAARAAGADSMIVVTDGELADRETARQLVERLGIGVREVRVAEAVERVAIRSLSASGAVTAGDTLDVRAEIVATARAGDSARVMLEFGTDVSATVTIERPAAGRSVEASFRVPVGRSADSTEWRTLDVRVEGASPPWDGVAAARSWVGVTPEPTGAVMISLDPDWEARYLSPVLGRSVPGGARAFLRVSDGEYIRVEARPAGGIPEASVRRAAEAASLLVVQGDPATLPGWIESIVRRSPAVMHLVRGPGRVPGTGVTVEEALPGEWYPEAPPPPSPVSGHLLGAEVLDLPPLSRLYGSAGRADGPVLSARRDRQGGARPVAVLGSTQGRRWAVVHGEGAWRWAARRGQGLALYRGLFAGMTRWLVEHATPRPLQMQNPSPRTGDSIRWRAAPDVRDLAIHLEDASGAVVWSDTSPPPTMPITGPPLERGDARFVATGSVGGVPFRIQRPFHVNAGAEELPGVVGPPLDVRPANLEGEGRKAGSDPPVWPFAAAIVLLCAEWLWRRKVGLR